MRYKHTLLRTLTAALLCGAAHAEPSAETLVEAYAEQTAYYSSISFKETQARQLQMHGDDQRRDVGEGILTFWREGRRTGVVLERYSRPASSTDDEQDDRPAHRQIRMPLKDSGGYHAPYNPARPEIRGVIVYLEDPQRYITSVYVDFMGGAIVDGMVHEARTGRVAYIAETLRALLETDPAAVRVEDLPDGGAALIADTHDGRYQIEFTGGASPTLRRVYIERVGTADQPTAGIAEANIVGTVSYDIQILRREDVGGRSVPAAYIMLHRVRREHDGTESVMHLHAERTDMGSGEDGRIEPKIADGTIVKIINDAEHKAKTVIGSATKRDGTVSDPMELHAIGMAGVAYVWQGGDIRPAYNGGFSRQIDAWTAAMREQGFSLLDSMVGRAGFRQAAVETNRALLEAQAQAPADDDASPGLGVFANHPHCGIYAVYTLLKLHNPEHNFQTLLTPVYVGEPTGSSMRELASAAMDHGLHAAAATEMTSLDLRAARIPIILHIRSSPLLEDFDHWTLFLGCHDGKALLYEAGFGAMEIGLAELLSRWDGNGIYVAGEPIEPLATKAAAAVQRVVFVILAGLAFAGVGLLARRTTAALPPTAARRLRSPLAVCLGVVCAGAAAAAAHHSASPQGFLRNPDTLRSVTTRFFTDFMESVTSEELDALIQNPGSAVVVDARSAGTFRTGLHIEGAINVPYTSSLANAASVLRSVETDKLIVVYCDNASCTFAGVVARKLHTIGYNNIKIYHNGWKGWVAYKNINQGELLFGKDTE